LTLSVFVSFQEFPVGMGFFNMFRGLSTGTQRGCDRAIHRRNELKLPFQPAGLLGGVCGMLSLQHQGIQILLLKQPAMRNHGRDALCSAIPIDFWSSTQCPCCRILGSDPAQRRVALPLG
jgi:hypothetical protein